MKKITLLIPSLSSGGAERVMSVLANYLSKDINLEIHLILYLADERFYNISDKVIVHTPNFNYKNFSTIISTFKTINYIRKTLKDIKPNALLSFSGKYNSLVILSSLGLNIKRYVSDRSKPGISYGKLQDILNPILYGFTNGIIAQTSKAKEVAIKQTKHNNIVVIPNPIANNICFEDDNAREKIILNVGRFIATKQQLQLIELFSKIDSKDWELVFLGDGKYLNDCIRLVSELKLENKIKFLGVQKNVADYMKKASIFSFTSISEGFPNSLAEAMALGCSCISFDCVAGPSDIIDHKSNGFLVPENDWEKYKYYLNELMNNEDLRKNFALQGYKKVSFFEEEFVSEKFKELLIS